MEIYREGLKVLKKYALNGKFKQQENGMGALALMLQIVSLNTIDFLRSASRRHERELEYASRFKASRFDDNPHKLGEAFIKVNEFIDTDLKELEQVAVREYVELLRGQHCFESDGPPEKLLPAKVREVLKQPDLADKVIWAAHKSGMAKLREFLTGGMLWSDPNETIGHGGKENVVERENWEIENEKTESLNSHIYSAIAWKQAMSFLQKSDQLAALSDTQLAAFDALGTP